MNYKIIDRCRICSSTNLIDVFSFPEQFLSPTFVESNKGNSLTNIKVPLTVTLCDVSKNPKGCGLVQLRETTNHDLLYTNYFYRSATNATMRRDLKDVVDDVLNHAKPIQGDVVVDIGSNDGTMLTYFPSDMIRIGVEPAKNISWKGLDPSIRVVNDYFSERALRETLSGKKVKIFTACAMFYDLDDPNTFVAEIKTMLAPDGIFCIQLSYLVAMLKNMNFYDVCHEHLEYYSLTTLNTLMERHGLTIFDAELNAVNGGSARVFVAHKDSGRERSQRYQKLIKEEERMKLFDPKTYIVFHEKIMELAATVKRYIINEIKRGNTVIGLGASTKGNVLLQLFGIDNSILPYISEINPEKIGKRTLGTDIELISDGRARELRPSVKLVLPWYFKTEIVKREETYLAQGGKLLFPMPYAHLVSKAGEENL